MKKALVLAGGGTRGSYQNGVVHALRRLGKDDWNMVCGTSIGALNAALVVQHDYKPMDEMWHNLKQEQIINGVIPIDMDLNEMINDRADISSFVKKFLKDKGADISPLISYIERLYNPERFFESDIDFGCVCAKHRTKEPVFVDKDMMKEHGLDWLIATASAYPAFPVHEIDGQEYIDGGYFDNLPIDLALQKGADEIIAVDLNSEPQHPNFMDRPNITYIFPRTETGSFLVFDKATVMRLETCGYYDTMKTYHVFDGVKYTFEKADLPSWWHDFYLEILKLETRIKLASSINDRFRSTQVITDWLLLKEHARIMDDKDMYYGFMDSLMDLADCDVQKIWTYREARSAILLAFADCVREDYQYYPPLLKPTQLLGYFRTLDAKGIISKILYANLYPEHMALSENMRLTINPIENAQALFVTYLMKDLQDTGI